MRTLRTVLFLAALFIFTVAGTINYTWLAIDAASKGYFDYAAIMMLPVAIIVVRLVQFHVNKENS